jgi:hypothetical protein
LPAIYAERAATVVVFVSADYAARDWTRLERRAALDRAVRERREYVLPADNTVIRDRVECQRTRPITRGRRRRRLSASR